jgi:hypothetical protein
LGVTKIPRWDRVRIAFLPRLVTKMTVELFPGLTRSDVIFSAHRRSRFEVLTEVQLSKNSVTETSLIIFAKAADGVGIQRRIEDCNRQPGTHVGSFSSCAFVIVTDL